MKPPRIEIELAKDQHQFSPSDFLLCEYRLRAVEGLAVQAIETSVLWIAGGKGSEDIGVHFFQRASNDAISPSMLQRPHRISTVLPNSPLSYPGELVSVRWCVRVRMFYGNQQQLIQDHPFVLGDAEAPKNLTKQSNEDTIDGDSIDDAIAPPATVTTPPIDAPHPR